MQPASRTVTAGATLTLNAGVSGTTPLQFLWHKDGNALPNQTALTLAIPTVAPGDAGVYQLRVSNRGGTAWSSNAIVTVLSPPYFLKRPESQTVDAGGNVTFSIEVGGLHSDPTFSVQWRKGSQIVAAGTNLNLTLTNVTQASAGLYTVVVSNPLGSATADAVLTVTQRVVPLELLAPRILPDGTISLEASASALLQYSTNLVDWADLEVIMPDGPSAQFTVRVDAAAQRKFYRLKAVASTNAWPAGQTHLNPFKSKAAKDFLI